jgi:hypothetical protein
MTPASAYHLTKIAIDIFSIAIFFALLLLIGKIYSRFNDKKTPYNV